MGNLERRLGRLEDGRQRGEAELSREALRQLSDEDLDALEDALEAGQENGTATFEDLYRVVTESGRRALDAYIEVLEAIARGEEPRASPTDRAALARLQRIEAGDEEALGERRTRDGYRIWKYRK